jgi:hypothetical protein
MILAVLTVLFKVTSQQQKKIECTGRETQKSSRRLVHTSKRVSTRIQFIFNLMVVKNRREDSSRI